MSSFHLFPRENIPSRSWIDFRQLKLASLYACKLASLSWRKSTQEREGMFSLGNKWQELKMSYFQSLRWTLFKNIQLYKYLSSKRVNAKLFKPHVLKTFVFIIIRLKLIVKTEEKTMGTEENDRYWSTGKGYEKLHIWWLVKREGKKKTIYPSSCATVFD